MKFEAQLKTADKMYTTHWPEGAFQILFHGFCPKMGGGYPQNQPKVVRQKYCPHREVGGYPPSPAKIIPPKNG